MSKSLAASQKLMKTYLSELLTDGDEQIEQPLQAKAAPQKQDEVKPAPVKEGKDLQQLLEQVPSPSVVTSKKAEHQAEKVVEQRLAPTEKSTPVVEPPAVDEALLTKKASGMMKLKADKDYRQGSFQAMFFDVAGLTIAVPLIELGGIHNVEKVTPMMGKPDWFKGVMLHRDEKINVVDSARWVMPEKCDESLLNSLNYQYIIMLSDSRWGFAAENLIDTVTLEQSDVKWLDSPSKRPWLAGLVKDRMCALLEVEALIKLLEDGANIHQYDE